MKKIFFALAASACTLTAAAQNSGFFGEEDIPLKKVTLYSSGVAHYLHEGAVTGERKLNLSFSPSQINDVLKSLVFMDPAAKELNINYESENTLQKALESLKVNLFSSASIYDILKAQKGAEIEILTPNKITGKILSVDTKNAASEGDFFISLASEKGIRLVPFNDIQSFKFTDEKLNADLNTALNLILNASAKNRKVITVNVRGTGKRTVRLSYIMEAPIWKPSYRIDMGTDSAAFQAWAIVDNSTDLDWKDIKLTLTTGRPVGFKQNLYKPYYTYRPEIPLAIAQTAEAETFSSSMKDMKAPKSSARRLSEEMDMALEQSNASLYDEEYKESYGDSAEYFENRIETDSSVGEMFAFTPAKSITLDRQKSTMIPLSLSSMPAEKFSVFSNIPGTVAVNPKLCISFENTSGLKLPPGPITVFDNGKYVGDALLEFLPEGEKRIIAFGDDIEVEAFKIQKPVYNIEKVKIVEGVLTVLNKTILDSAYTVKNAGKQKKTLVIEHPIRYDFKLLTEENLMEKTANKYRFKVYAEGRNKIQFTVKEEKIEESVYTVYNMSDSEYISIASNADMPEKLRKVFEEIIKEKQKITFAKSEYNNLQSEFKQLSEEQDRVRKNLGAVGSESRQGQEFLDKLLKLENDLDGLKVKIKEANKKLKMEENNFKEYLKKINL
ncbi:DUF4139 domain-containing protein [Treponema pedis]|uniref:DUF4139 domain-containing protein n=1 Tax=Treponema pedis TaxID=409322 RepID=UPI0003F75A93|nr:DUF4139 domain-containing protein [Treponema pedis]